jgi:hypothetical protein
MNATNSYERVSVLVSVAESWFPLLKAELLIGDLPVLATAQGEDLLVLVMAAMRDLQVEDLPMGMVKQMVSELPQRKKSHLVKTGLRIIPQSPFLGILYPH